MKNVIVIATRDAILAIDKAHDQEVKQTVERIEQQAARRCASAGIHAERPGIERVVPDSPATMLVQVPGKGFTPPVVEESQPSASIRRAARR